MRLRIEKLENRFPAGKLPVFLFFAFFLVYLGLHFGLEASSGFCWFRHATGISCPTCGLSRSFLSLAQGKVLTALRFNPFMLVFTLGILIQQIAVLLFKRRIAIQTTPRENTILLCIFLALFISNWIYMIFTLA